MFKKRTEILMKHRYLNKITSHFNSIFHIKCALVFTVDLQICKCKLFIIQAVCVDAEKHLTTWFALLYSDAAINTSGKFWFLKSFIKPDQRYSLLVSSVILPKRQYMYLIAYLSWLVLIKCTVFMPLSSSFGTFQSYLN